MKSLILFLAVILTSPAFGWGYYGPKKHNFSLMLGTSKTKLETKEDKEKTTIYTKHELDLGVQYQYRFKNKCRIGVMGTKQENVYFTIGFDW